MNAVFADTFYWAALTNIDDPANACAMNLSRSLAPDRIVTTDEVLAEYLTFFAGARASIRNRAGRNVAELIDNLAVRNGIPDRQAHTSITHPPHSNVYPCPAFSQISHSPPATTHPN